MFNANPTGAMWPTEAVPRCSFWCQLTANGEVSVAAGNVYVTLVTLSGMLTELSHQEVTIGADVLTGLVDGDVICVKLALTRTWFPENYVDDNAVSGGDTVTVYQRQYQLDAGHGITVNETPASSYPWWRLATYRKSGDVEWLERHYVGDIHYTLPGVISQNLV